MQMKILSWNIWGGKYLSEVIKFVKKSKADVIGLQEVLQDVDGKNNIAQIIAEKLGYEWIYYSKGQIDFYGKISEWGNAVLSKYPIDNRNVHNLFNGDDNRIAVEADIKIQNRILSVFCTHLIHTHQKPSKVQETQAKNLIKILPKENVILMGDFNANPKSEAIKILSKVLINTDKNNKGISWSIYPGGCKTCNPKGLLNEKLDYIFTSEDIKIQSFKVESSIGSDHFPISVLINI